MVQNSMRDIKSILLAFGMSCSLAACGTSNFGLGGDSGPKQTLESSPELIEIDRRLSELEAMKPSLMRLISIETDIKALINELNTLADNYSGSPDGSVAETSTEDDEIEYLSVSDLMGRKAPEFDPAEDEPKKDTPTILMGDATPAASPRASNDTPAPSISAPPQKSAGMASYFALHLTSYSDARNLLTGWNKLQKRHSDLLTALTPKVEWITTASGASFLRLKAGPFATRAEANQACRTIRARDDYCAVDDYDGADIKDFIIQ